MATFEESDSPRRDGDGVCPFCGQAGGTVVLVVSAREATLHFLRPHQDAEVFALLIEHIRKLWGSDSCSLIQCGSCAGVYSWPFVGGDADYYALAYKHVYGYPQNRWEFGVTLETLRADSAALSRRCLEMGAGDGSFLKRLLGLGFAGRKVCAVEYSERARQSIAAIDSAVECVSSLEEISGVTSGECFGYAFAFQVLEHLGEPVEFLTTLRDLIVADGLAFISVPNPARIRFNETHGLLLDMPPNHVSRIGEKAMESLARRVGFRVERSVVQPFDSRAALKQFVTYRFKRQTQLTGTMENVLERRLPSVGAKGVGALLAAPKALATLPGRTDGESVLFVLRKV